MKPTLLFLAATAYASPLLQDRQSTCPTSFLSTARASEIRSKFAAANVIPDSVPSFTPTTELTVKYGNINENLGNTFSVQRLPLPLPLALPAY
jgi:hypothetical protein